VSRAFVKEGDETETLPDRPVSEHPNDVTREGLERIEAALQSAQKAYAAAQEAGDRAALPSASRDLRYWTARRSSAIVIPDPSDNSLIRFGHTVTIVREDDRRQTFRIVGEDEADPRQGDDLPCRAVGPGSVRQERWRGDPDRRRRGADSKHLLNCDCGRGTQFRQSAFALYDRNDATGPGRLVPDRLGLSGRDR